VTGENFTCTEHFKDVYCVALSSNGVYAASGSDIIQIWDLVHDKKSQTLEGHVKGVYGVVFSPTNKAVASVGYDGQVHLWDIVSGAILKDFNSSLVGSSSFDCIRFSQDQQYITIGPHCFATGLPGLGQESSTIMDMQQFPIHYLDGGWVMTISGKHHICWIPQSERGLLVSTANGIVLGTPSGKIIILDFSNLDKPE
jgi:WD40 repeat protein